MAEITIFEDEAFNVANLILTLNDDHVVPGQIAASGLFTEQGSTTIVQQIEKSGTTLQLVPSAPRGSGGQAVIADKRKLIPFNTVHLPQPFTILADEIQGIRAFGSRTELMGVQDVVNARLDKARRQLDTTHEYQRIGAIKGQVIDADGETVLVDIYQSFGIKRPKAFSMGLDNAATDVSAMCVEVLDAQEDELYGLSSTGARAYCGRNFWKKFISHDKVRESYLASEAAATLRGDRRKPFEFGGITWERYRGKVGGVPFVGDDTAYVVAEGVEGLYISVFAPADWMETVNTLGLPYYGKLEVMRMGRGVEGEAQSNPLHLCTRPLATRELTI
ncbi:major capsid protein [Pseudomonas panipatensis]|uniref:Phage major capsid protein E n=1 Tax=Pseudomonas panipatensis TaxID=428992 RepID=A0A1G8CV71_9PSED|nr:major capsid protein [Pseudomonas panipatensis]SDH49447.1 Phage major capsid protein E [Pseudomonas panipatensis]SMP63337.1 Phage major capsid protein E [Pseudomonas panipatensis]